MGSTRFGYVFLIFLISLRSLDSAKDTLNQNDTLTGNQTLVSSGERFEFGFFDLRNTTDGISRYYVGIWYHGILPRTVVWVANREDPFGNSSGFIGFRSGNLMVSGDVNFSSIWWSMDTGSNVDGINLIVQIKDYGNLEFIQVENDILIWQSFQFPTDTFLPGQMLILDNSKNELTTLTPWTNDADPSPGNFSLFLDPRGFSSSYFQLLTVDNPNTEMSANSTSIGTGDVIHWRSGLWSGSPVAGGFNGINEIPPNGIYGFSLIPNVNGDGAQYTYRRQKNDDDLRVRFVLLGNGTLTTYIYQQNKWIYNWSLPLEACDFYNYCGKNAVCDQTNNPRCQCLLGFKPSLAFEWDRGNWSAGCTRNTKIKDGCQPTDIGFLNLTHVKTPDLQTVYRPANATTTSESICREYCMKSCNCTAYVYIDNNGCYTWDEDLFDLQNLTRISRGSKLSIKLNVTDLPPILGGTKEMSRAGTLVAIVLTVFGISIFLVLITIFIWTRYKLNFKGIFRDKFKISSLIISSNFSLDSVRDNELSGEQRSPVEQQQSPIEQQQHSPIELPLLDLKVIRSATNDFSESNFLGKGGFGHVYKGVLPEGDVVAIKRLSKNSFQGLVEFKNEMMLIAKLQHRNLVRMKGVCIQESEQILVYEYMSNKSLDDFIFNREKNHIIDWKTRFGIIQGIARGILYLHRDSRLPIVHRDLKASNILLDDEMNPKISDFGMARIFGGNQDNQDKTNRIVGTFGYMSPEYAMKGMFSVKSDVYSFGVLILEIICGIKINRFETDENLNLLGYAWKLWIEDKGMELVDPIIKNTCSKEDDVLRCEHVALLCVQDRPIDRPTMSDVVMMLGTELSIKQIPEEPAFTIDKSFVENVVTTHARYIYEQNFSPNELTISELTFR